MSVLSPVIDSIDGPPNIPAIRIYLKSGITSFHPVDDIYKEVRQRRLDQESLRGLEHFAEAGGNVSKGGGKFTPRYLILKNGAKIIPYDISQTLNITGEIFSDDLSPVFDTTTLSAGTSIFFNYTPAEAEVIQVSTGSGLSAAQAAQLSNTEQYALAARQAAIGKAVISSVANTLTVFALDGVTPLAVLDLQDDNGDPSTVSIFRRIPQ